MQTALNPLQVVPSTTSHKAEPLLPTLELFARLGLCTLDLNLNHLVERGVRVDDVCDALAANGQRAALASGGWCDFFDQPPNIDETFGSVARQVALARRLGSQTLRLFFGRLELDRYGPTARGTAVANIQQVADEYRDLLLVFENHDGASSFPRVCRQLIEDVDRPNVRLNFDPINFEHRGVASLGALRELQPVVAHVHLKGYSHGQFCEFGAGQVDLGPVVRALVEGGYTGGFTVEYEGTFDRTLRLYLGLRNAEAMIAHLRAAM